MPKSADITEFRRLETVLEDLTVQYRLQYKVDGVWYDAESNAEATANEALQVAQDAKDIAQAASDKVDTFDDRLTIAEGDASDAKQDAIDAKELAEDTAETVGTFDTRITQAEQNASDAKSIAQTTSGNLTTHTSNTNNPHQVTKAQVGLGNVDNTSDLNKPVSTATQNFVNSSIATSTATFRGTYNSLAELEAVTADENDYGFVVATDSAGNTVYNRYKYTTSTTPASWVFEYALNNSSFTAQQWATINSGATANDVALARSAVQPSDVGNGTITITQGGTTKGTFTTNQGGNTTIDLDAGTADPHRVIAFQAPTAANNYTWYRKYADGWVEQGGYYTGVVNTGSSVSITLPITMVDANYIVLITGEQNSNAWSSASLKDSSRTTTGFDIFAVGGSSGDKIKGASWQVSGMSAS
jgi:hypothetical protein